MFCYLYFLAIASFRKFYVPTMTWLPVTDYPCKNDHGYVPFVVITIRSFPHLRLITRRVTIVTWHEARTSYPSEALGSTPSVLWGTVPFWSTWVHARCFVGYATLLEHLGPRQVFCGVRYPSGALGSTPGVLWGTLSFWSTWVHARCFVRFVLNDL
jgi:hypothetical protein